MSVTRGTAAEPSETGRATCVDKRKIDMSWHGGKGSKRRPESKSKFDEGFERAFGRQTKCCGASIKTVRAGDDGLDTCTDCGRCVEGERDDD